MDDSTAWIRLKENTSPRALLRRAGRVTVRSVAPPQLSPGPATDAAAGRTCCPMVGFVALRRPETPVGRGSCRAVIQPWVERTSSRGQGPHHRRPDLPEHPSVGLPGTRIEVGSAGASPYRVNVALRRNPARSGPEQFRPRLARPLRRSARRYWSQRDQFSTTHGLRSR